MMRYQRFSGFAVAAVMTLLTFVRAGAQVNSDTPGYFPFVIPPLDTSSSFVDMSYLSPEPAGAAGPVTVRDGHFYDGHGKRLRLLGTNMTFGGAFPDHEHATLIAAHLRKLGINVIRFHHMDNRSAPGGIWLPDFSGLDPQQVDKLDYFIYQLKLNGIYANLNLHVSRTYPGIPKDLERTFNYGKSLDNFYPRFIELQKQYAKMLLTHRNPYTKTTYAEEPAIIVVETNNENSLTTPSLEALCDMPDPFRSELARQWRAWLGKHYHDTKALRAQWNVVDEPLGAEVLTNSDFHDGIKGWQPERGNGAKMDLTVVDDSQAKGGRALEVKTLKAGTQSWDLQLHQIGLDLTAGKAYTLSFQARSDKPRDLSVGVRLDQAPWTMCGLNLSTPLGREWRDYSYTFKCVNPVPKHCRVSFNFNSQLGEFRFANVSLRPGGLIGLPPDQSLEAGNVDLPTTNADDAEQADFYQFLSDTECNYVWEMRQYLHQDLGVKAHICDSQDTYGGILGMYREGSLSDYIDAHAYWQHPHFPGRPWDSKNWFIPNTSMVADPNGGTLPRLAWCRMQGKPFTVSEYNHPAPNEHRAEMYPMIASFAAFQDWDGFYQFDWGSRTDNYDQAKMNGYFELCADPSKLAFLPIAALMFREGAVAAGTNPVVATLHTGDLGKQCAATDKNFAPASDLKRVPLERPVAFRLADGDGPVDVPKVTVPDGPCVSSTGQIRWDATDPKQATYTVNAPAVRAAVGFIGGREIRLGDATIHVTTAKNNWAAVAIAALDGKPIEQSGKILVAVVGDVENSNMGWNKERTSVGNQWGSAPTIAEGITVTIQVPGAAKVQALDGTGKPVSDVASSHTPAGTQFVTGPQYRTLWYAVTR